MNNGTAITILCGPVAIRKNNSHADIQEPCNATNNRTQEKVEPAMQYDDTPDVICDEIKHNIIYYDFDKNAQGQNITSDDLPDCTSDISVQKYVCHKTQIYDISESSDISSNTKRTKSKYKEVNTVEFTICDISSTHDVEGPSNRPHIKSETCEYLTRGKKHDIGTRHDGANDGSHSSLRTCRVVTRNAEDNSPIHQVVEERQH